jgi:hypothetical protein
LPAGQVAAGAEISGLEFGHQARAELLWTAALSATEAGDDAAARSTLRRPAQPPGGGRRRSGARPESRTED